MVMKTVWIIMAACLCAWNPAMGARVATYPDALKRAGDKGAVLFCYGAGWDHVSEQAYEAFVKSRKIDRAVRSAPLLELPLYDTPTPEQKANFDRIMGGKNLPGGLRSVPCLAIVDESGTVRDAVQGAEEMADVDKALELLAEKMKKVQQQNKLLALSERASGNRKLELLVEAENLGAKIPARYLKNLPPDPPHDKKGNAARLKFDPIAVVAKLQGLSTQEAEEKVRKMLELKSYTPEQRQQMFAALTGHIRRSGGSPSDLARLYKEMEALDPDSMYGAYAKEALRIWGGGAAASRSQRRNTIEPGSE